MPSADPVRAIVSALRGDLRLSAVYSDGLPPDADFPCLTARASGGQPDSGYNPLNTYSVDVLAWAETASAARRLAYRAHDALKQKTAATIVTAGLVHSAICNVPPTQDYDEAQKRYFYFQEWDIIIGDIDGVD